MNGEGGGTPRIRRADVFMQTWNGVTNRLEKLYGRASLVAGNADVQVIPLANLENVEKSLQDKSIAFSLPYVAIAPSVIEPNTGSYNASVMRKYGVKARISEDRSTWTILSMVPIVVTFQVMLVTDDVLTLVRMVDRWMSNELWGFVLQGDDYRIHVKITADKSMQVPPKTPDAGGVDQFRQTTTLRVETYSGYLWQVPSIYAVDFQTAVTQQTLDALEANGQIDQFDLTRVITAPSHQPAA